MVFPWFFLFLIGFYCFFLVFVRTVCVFHSKNATVLAKTKKTKKTNQKPKKQRKYQTNQSFEVFGSLGSRNLWFLVFKSACLLRRAPGSKHAPGVQSWRFYVGGLAPEGPGLKTRPGGSKLAFSCRRACSGGPRV